jgi:hypothetical protein
MQKPRLADANQQQEQAPHTRRNKFMGRESADEGSVRGGVSFRGDGGCEPLDSEQIAYYRLVCFSRFGRRSRRAGCGVSSFMSFCDPLLIGIAGYRWLITGDTSLIAGDESLITGDESSITGDEWG